MKRNQPIDEIWKELGVPTPERIRDQLTAKDIADLLRSSRAVHFWVTDVFHGVIERIPLNRCFAFWKEEVKERVVEEEGFAREQWPGGYAYLASEWRSPFPEPVVELMRWE
jgi:hypothetical protein